eukprot:CAMPEP_0202685642 /NCGR_PEP_ID=MMETSP1385-20130828/1458_1 /ASSEMBLY_ACC=CAM_ASM_000861 /TAXON_ID=933848 /ORGANISM="Elphidium margaritaceum" /LENGTH=809 /DNA_ID=CAMNT_0049340057 /DNA_START=46 /DNA_END=2472 /DNA_ORIENTATION=+
MTSSVSTKSKRKPLYPHSWGTGNVAYVDTFRAFSMSVLSRSSLEIGDKIILPSQALERINRLRLPFPLIFEVRKFRKTSSLSSSASSSTTSSSSSSLTQSEIIKQYRRRLEAIYRSTNPTKLCKLDKWLQKYREDPHALYARVCKTYGIVPKPQIGAHRNNNNNNNHHRNHPQNKHKPKHAKSCGRQFCSVYEFSSPQSDSAYLPRWMMENLGIDEGDKIELQSQFNVAKGTFCKLQPFTQTFLDKMSTVGYRSTLEHSLRHYSVLSVQQRIVVEFNHLPYECVVTQTRPNDVISILGSTDLEVEFEEPLQVDRDDDDSGTKDTATSSSISEYREQKEKDATTLSSSSDMDSDMEFHPQQQQQQQQQIKQTEIDGALLKRLGVPLDYNEQCNLAMVIMENRRRNEEDQGDPDDEEDEEVSAEEEDAKTESVAAVVDDRDRDADVVDPDTVQCVNCGKPVHKMSIQMHEVHCVRENMMCRHCRACIAKNSEAQHIRDMHTEFLCLCNQTCVGKLAYDRHQQHACALRLMTCCYCDAQNITASSLNEHRRECREKTVHCSTCQKQYQLKHKKTHDCGVQCVLCSQRIAHSKDKLLHLLTDCPQRRAICNYCGVLRKCSDMEQHRKFCGARSEKCEQCNQFVSLMNMEAHVQSNCEWFNNKQLSSNNPYLDPNLLTDMRLDTGTDSTDKQAMDANAAEQTSLFGLLEANHEANMVAFDADTHTPNDADVTQLCPHCVDDDTWMNAEEFQSHIFVEHSELLQDPLTQTILASFNNPEIVQNEGRKKARKATSLNETKPKRRKLATNRSNKSDW